MERGGGFRQRQRRNSVASTLLLFLSVFPPFFSTLHVAQPLISI